MALEGAYPDLELGQASIRKPYLVINMVATIDGKTISGGRDEAVMDLGSELDHATMRQIQAVCDGVLIGAGSLRATKRIWYPKHLARYVATRSGELPWDSRFFTDAPDRAFLVHPVGTPLPSNFGDVQAGHGDVDWRIALALIRMAPVERLLCEGGSELNASLLREDLVDEIFLTVSPKVKLGRETPTLAGGEPLAREDLVNFELISCRPFDNEVFLRYRRTR